MGEIRTQNDYFFSSLMIRLWSLVNVTSPAGLASWVCSAGEERRRRLKLKQRRELSKRRQRSEWRSMHRPATELGGEIKGGFAW